MRMSDPKPPAPQADALARQLKHSLAHRRPRPWKLVLVTLAGSVLMLVLLAWWLYPGPKPALLQIIALDVVCPRDETPHVRAQLYAPPEDNALRRLSGYTVVFRKPSLPLAPDAAPRQVVAKSNERGQASVEWPVDDDLTAFDVLHIDPDTRRGSRDDARIYVWPKNAPLLIVDADETLVGDELDAQASETLTKAVNEGWHIVYLSLTSAQPHEFRKARGWIEEHSKLPKGPVVGRLHFSAAETIEQARHEVLKQLQRQFQGSMRAVVRSAESARVCQEIDVRAIVLGGAAAPAQVHAPTWVDVPVKLK
jgi:hypothetical protein